MYLHDLIAPLMSLYRVKILVKISAVVLAENRLTDGNWVACSRRGSAYFVKYLQMYWTIFAVFSPYESTLVADEGSVPYFPILQGTLPWQPNNVG